MKKYDIAVVGGDKRTACMASVLAKRGFEVICYGITSLTANAKLYHAASLKEAFLKAPVIVCGIPFAKNDCLYFEQETNPIPLTEVQRLLRKNHKVFGGVIPEDFKRLCHKRDIACFDFMQEEPLTLFNAISTAEGAILEAMLHQSTQLHQSSALVLGYGRCGKVLAHKLSGLSACVTVCCASPIELAAAHALGFETLPLTELSAQIGNYEYLFNTIPAPVLNRECLEELNPDALVIDIASNRVGVDYEAASQLKRNVLFCPGLPGKYSAVSCAEKMTEFVLSKI